MVSQNALHFYRAFSKNSIGGGSPTGEAGIPGTDPGPEDFQSSALPTELYSDVAADLLNGKPFIPDLGPAV